MTGGKKGNNILLDMNMSKGFNNTGKTSGLRGRANRSPDNEDNVLIDDNSSNGSKKSKGKMKRFTPREQRRPKVIFFRDPNVVEEYKNIKKLLMDRSKADSRNEVLDLTTSTELM